jgi:glutamate racemase
VLRITDAPIGVFDSGVGGLTVVKSLRSRLPHESVVYLGDTARIPYGTRSPLTVERYAVQNASFLDAMNIKMLVIACNTASALALPRLRAIAPSLPTLGVIQPGAKQAVRATRSGRIGVIGTEATVASGAYAEAIHGFNPSAVVTARACPLFVGLAEEGWTQHEEATRLIARTYLEPFLADEIDTLVLGCTHYPILREVIAEVMGPDVTLIDSGDAVTEEVAILLAERNQLRTEETEPESHFYVTDAADRFRRVAERFLGAPLERFETVDVVKEPQ